ncbi:uncharacterized protein LOC129717653 [Wyeomyia smithii]|uniref:uncharacterized protein LOC129717653 n=1 Tax=Wyeomyia smithii TaxID=174621 RepID=UPI002467F844|nr:uncharacterized protein LOC129717653 [Wyeomyia smithii]XP_055523697.1 uncharacterized protein LOC129717653 [Wyeomyia smithii]
MKIKMAKLVLLMSTFCAVPTLGGLLRTPKVYNAVITTDENLTPSRAYPVVQPVVHEAGLSYPFGAFGPFGLYNAFNAYPGFYQQQPTAAGPSAAQIQGRNSFFVGREPEPQLQDTPIETLPEAKPYPERNLPLREPPVPEIIPEPNNSIAPKAPEGPQPNFEGRPVETKNPLQLNEFGYPPSLIPVATYNSNGQLQSSPVFPYNFPVLYDSFGNYNPTQYQSVLPPFGYFPQLNQPNPYFNQNLAPNAPINNAVDPQQFNRDGREQVLQDANKESLQNGPIGTPVPPPVPVPVVPVSAPEEVANPEENKPEPPPPAPEAFDESIKNNANKNKDIPDVPPPPIPSGAKEVEQP